MTNEESIIFINDINKYFHELGGSTLTITFITGPQIPNMYEIINNETSVPDYSVLYKNDKTSHPEMKFWKVVDPDDCWKVDLKRFLKVIDAISDTIEYAPEITTIYVTSVDFPDVFHNKTEVVELIQNHCPTLTCVDIRFVFA